jgi:hypothetical protein
MLNASVRTNAKNTRKVSGQEIQPTPATAMTDQELRKDIWNSVIIKSLWKRTTKYEHHNQAQQLAQAIRDGTTLWYPNRQDFAGHSTSLLHEHVSWSGI